MFRDFVRMSACALAMQTREDEYLEVADRYSREELMTIRESFHALTEEMESKPFSDVL